MIKSKMTYALSAIAMSFSTGIMAPAVFAESAPTSCEGIENCAEIKTAEDLAGFFVSTGQGRFVTREGKSTMIISNDFTMSADYYIKDVDLSIYLGDQTVAMKDFSFLFYDSVVNIYGDNGSLTNADAYYAPLYLRENTVASINGGSIIGGQSEVVDGDKTYDPEPAVYLENGAKLVLNGGTLTAKTWALNAFANTEFTMNGGTVSATGDGSIAIAGNGTTDPASGNYGGNAKFTINGGVIESGELGIYAPQVDGVTTINGGNIEALTGVEVRAGTLNIYGGSIVVLDGAKYEVVGNGSGSTTTGAAVAVAQHTTRKPINVNITGGTFVGPVAFSEADPQDGDPVDVNLSISGGAFVGDIVSENYDLKDFVKSGDFSNYFENGERNASININGPVVADSPISFAVSEVEKSALTLADNGNKATLVAAFDFSLRDENGAIVSVNKEDGTELTISVIISDEQYEALKDKKVMVAFFDEEGKESGERVEGFLSQREDGVWIVTFVTNHLSTYGIVAEEENSGESETADTTTPETGTMTAAGASAANAAIVTAIAVGLLTSIVSFAYLIRRR
ncbi:hypothetical protein IKD67_03640 [Candidatus Saccharibacteria bacterium]|nr:hypothetical protein [Candidatus Saccharibacteria bacterium]